MHRRFFCVSAVVATALAGCGSAPDVFRPTSGSTAYDADNDGFADVAMYQQPDQFGGDGGALVILYGGQDGLSADRRSEAAFDVSYGMAAWIGDVNGDGYADAAVHTNTVGQSTNAVVVYGGPRSEAAKTVGLTCSQGDTFAEDWGSQVGWAGDVNGDGIDDLVMTARGARTCIWLGTPEPLNGESDVFFQKPGMDVTMYNWLGLGDLNDDGYNDLAGLIYGGPELTNTEDLVLPIFPSHGAADFNGDGATDLVTAVPGTFTQLFDMAFGPNLPNASVERLNFLFDQQATVTSEFAQLGDVDGDGTDDVAHFSPFLGPGEWSVTSDGAVELLYGSKDGFQGARDVEDRLTPVDQWAVDSSELELNGFVPGVAVGLGDINGDGFGDLGVESMNGGMAWILGSSKGFRSGVLEGWVIVNRTSPRVAATGAGAL